MYTRVLLKMQEVYARRTRELKNILKIKNGKEVDVPFWDEYIHTPHVLTEILVWLDENNCPYQKTK